MPKDNPYASIAEKPVNPYASIAEGAAPPEDFTANHKGEGVYEMRGPNGLVKIPYSQVDAASGKGFKLTSDAFKQYDKDKQYAASPPLSRFAESEYEAISGAAKGVGQFLDPRATEEEKQRGLTKPYDVLMRYPERIALPAVSEAEKAGDPSLGVTERVGHGLAAVTPVVGPWAAQVGEKAGQQAGQGNYAGAAGTVAGNAIVAEAPKTIPKAAEIGAGAVKAVAKGAMHTPESLRGMIRDTLGVTENTEKTVKDFGKESERVRAQHQKAEEATEKEKGVIDEANKTEREKVNAENIKKIEEDRDKRIAALKADKNNLAAHKAEIEKITKEANSNLRRERMRQKVSGALKDASSRLTSKVDAAYKNARSQYNASWNKWRDMVKDVKADMSPVVQSIKDQESNMSPQQVSEFRDILRETRPEADDLSDDERTRNEVIKGQGFNGTYDELPPKGKATIDKIMSSLGIENIESTSAAEVPASRLHGWKSQLEVAVRNSHGVVKHAIGKVLDQVRALETQVSDTVPGAKQQLLKSRAITGPYFDAFIKSPQPEAKAAAQMLGEQARQFTKEEAQQNRVNRIAAYDPSVGALVTHVNNLQNALKIIKPPPPDYLQVSGSAKPTPTPPPESTPPTEAVEKPYKEPHSKETAPNAPDIRAENRAYIDKGLQRYGKVGSWVLRLIAGGAAKMLSHGSLTAFGTDLLIGQTAVSLLTKALRSDSVLDWLAKPSAEDIKMLDTLPPADADKMRQALGALAEEDKRLHPSKANIKLNPKMSAFIGGAAASQSKSPSEVKKEAEKLSPPSGGEARNQSPSDVMKIANELHGSFQNAGMAPV